MIFQRTAGGPFYYKFKFKGRVYYRSTNSTNKRAAEKIEAAAKNALAMGKFDLLEKRSNVPTLKEFAPEFLEEIRMRSADHPDTIQFYESKLAQVLKEPYMAGARLDAIDGVLPKFIAAKLKQKLERSTVNRYLATIRRALRLAAKRKIITHAPSVELLSGENRREYTLSQDMEPAFLEACSAELNGQLRNVAIVALHTGLRRKELLSLRWADIHVKPANKSQRGYIQVRGTKSKLSQRNLTLVKAVQSALMAQEAFSKSEFVFVSFNDATQPMSAFTLAKAFARARVAAKLPEEFVLHSLRHTFGTRLGEAGADAFTIMRAMGHSSLAMTQRYVHPTPVTMENAFLAMEELALPFTVAATTPNSAGVAAPRTKGVAKVVAIGQSNKRAFVN